VADRIVSVAMCTFNAARYIEEQFSSIARQSRLPDELVVCDDGSHDRTVEIVRSLAAAVPFSVRVVENPTNLGCNRNFEKAISLCRGTIIFLSDHDDVWHRDKIEQTIAAMREDGVGAAFTDAAVVSNDLTPLGFTLWMTVGFDPERQQRFQDGEQFSELLHNNVMQGAAAAFKSSFRDAILPIPQEWQHDHWIALIISAVAEIHFVDRPLLDYRQHAENLLGAAMPAAAPNYWTKLGRRIVRLGSLRRHYETKLDAIDKILNELDILQKRLVKFDWPLKGDPISMIEQKRKRLTTRRKLTELKATIFTMRSIF
jgi:glycosyltransferase involved in cell wall biosynthesis